MNRSLPIVLVLLMGFATWQIGFHTPPSSFAQDAPPQGDEPAAEETRDFGDLFGAGFSGAESSDLFEQSDSDDDPFGTGTVAGPPGGDSAASRAKPLASAEWQRPYSRNFQLELTVVAEDGRSFQKATISGTATVTPASLRELPEVSVKIAQAGMGPGYGGGGYGGEAGGYGDMYGGAMEAGFGSEMLGGDRGVRRLNDAQRREIEQRVTWQAQADWVRQTLRSDAKLSEEDVEELKKLVREVLKNQYADQLRRQGLELQVVERRLANLRGQLARRAEAADRVVDFELQRLDLEAGGLGLGPDAQLQPAQESPYGEGQGYGGMQ